MACHINLVEGNTGPTLIIQFTDDVSKLPIDLSAGSGVLKFRQEGATALTDTLTGTRITGFTAEDGTTSFVAPYNVAGRGGRMSFAWNPTSLAGAVGQYEGEVTLTLPGPVVQTVFETIKFTVRPSF